MIALVAYLLIAMPAPTAPCPKEEPIHVYVLVILASDKNNDVHEKLAKIAAEIRKKAPELTSFDLDKTIKQPLKVGDSIQVDLVGNAKMEVRLNERTDEQGRMTMTIKPPKLDEITYACTCGKFFPIITNHYTRDNKRLIIAVMAQPCKKKQ